MSKGRQLPFFAFRWSRRAKRLGVLTIARAEPLRSSDVKPFKRSSEQLSLALANLKLQDSLRNQSLRDPLTGLYNRRYMDEALSQHFARATRGANAAGHCHAGYRSFQALQRHPRP